MYALLPTYKPIKLIFPAFRHKLLTGLCYKVPNKIPIKSSIYQGNSRFGNQLLCLPILTQLKLSLFLHILSHKWKWTFLPSSSQVWDFSLSLLTSLCYKVPNKIPIKSSIYHGNSNFGNQLLCLPRLTQLRMSQNLGKFMLPRSGTTHPDYNTGNLLVLNW